MRKVLKIIAKTLKIILVTLGIIVAVLVLLFFIPVKFAVQPEDIEQDREHYIVYFITPYSTDSGCYIYDVADGSTVCRVELTGADPRKDIASSIHYSVFNKFIIYGTLDGKQLHADKWDILERVERGGTHEKYLTVYDYKFFNIFENESDW